MPARSKAQRHVMAAAAHGASFPLAKKLRSSMSLSQLRDFSSTSEKGLPSHVKAPSVRSKHARGGK
jgi:hypothetical protein